MLTAIRYGVVVLFAAFASLSTANENLPQALQGLNQLETDVVSCYREKTAAEADGRGSSRINCYDRGSSNIFTIYRKSLRRLGFNTPDIRSDFSAMVTTLYSCRNRVANVRPELAVQEICAADAINAFRSTLSPGQPIDSEPPVVNISSPTNGADLTSLNVTITGTATDTQSAIASVTVNGVTANLSATSFSAALVLSEGANTITATATDTAGNQADSTISITVTLDNEPPSNSEVVIQLNALEAKILACLTAKAEAEANGQTAGSVNCFNENGRSVYAPFRRLLRDLDLFDNNARSGYKRLRQSVLACRGADSNLEIAQQLQCAANAFDTFQAIIAPGGGSDDTQAPEVSINPLSDQPYLNTPIVQVTGSVTDDSSGVAGVSVNGVAATVAGNSFSTNVTLNNQGTNTLLATATDNAGNSASASTTIALDSIAPELTIDEPAAGIATQLSAIEIRASATDALSGVSAVEINGQLTSVPNELAVVVTTNVTLTPGLNTIPLMVRDAAGNQTTGAIDIVSDATAPTVTIDVPQPDQIVTLTPTVITGTAQDIESGITTVTVNGTNVELDNGTYTTSIELAEGPNTITVVATNGTDLATTTSTTVVFEPGNGDSTPPMVDNLYPVLDAADVALNSKVIVRFSEPLLSTSISDTSLLLKMGETSVASQVLVSPDGLSLTLTPNDDLEANTLYQIQTGALTDLAGNGLTAPVTSSFTTGDQRDQNRARVLFFNIANGATDVPANAIAQVQFDRRIDPASLISSRFYLYDDSTNQTIEGVRQIDVSGESAAFIPSKPLPAGRNIRVRVQSLTDANGQSVTFFSSNFTVGFATDSIPPVIGSVSPTNNLQAAPTNSKVIVRFSEPVFTSNPQNAITLTADGSPVAGTLALSDGNRLAIFTPADNLAANTEHSISLAAVWNDVTGQAVSAGVASTFTTGESPSYNSLQLVSGNIAKDATDIPTDVVLRARFAQRIAIGSVSDRSVKLINARTNQPVSANLNVNAGLTEVTLSPLAPLAPNDSFYLAIYNELLTLSGETYRDQRNVITFTTSATTDSNQTAAVSSVITNAATVPTNADFPVELVGLIDTLSALDASVTVTAYVNGISTPIAATLSLAADGQSLVISPTQNLPANSQITLALTGIFDIAGNSVEMQPIAFNTGSGRDFSGPNLLSSTPTADQTNVSITAPVILRFDDILNPATVDIGTTYLSVRPAISSNSAYSEETRLAADYSVNANTLTITPNAPLPGNREIRVSWGGLTNISGYRAYSQTDFTFTTENRNQLEPPRLIAIYPEDGATGVLNNTDVVLMFSKSIETTSINENALSLFINGEQTTGYITRSTDNRTLILNPYGLPANALVEVATSGLTDVAGNIAPNIRTSFTTTSSDNQYSSPVRLQRPKNGATQVDRDSIISLVLQSDTNPDTVAERLHVTQNGVAISGQLNVDPVGNIYQFLADEPFAADALIEIFVDPLAQSSASQNASRYHGSFNVAPEETIAFGVVGVNPSTSNYPYQPEPLDLIPEILFSEALDASTVSSETIYLSGSDQAGSTTEVTVALSLHSSDTLLRIIPTTALAPNTTYTLRLRNNVRSISGASLRSGSDDSLVLTRFFNTGEADSPELFEVISASPGENADGVALNAAVRFWLNNPANALSINDESVRLTDALGRQIPVSTEIENDNRAIVLTPVDVLTSSTRYALDIVGLTNPAGTANTNFSTSFTTGQEIDLTRPQMLASSPTYGAADAPTDAALEVVFDEALDLTRLHSSQITIRDDINGSTLTGSVLAGTPNSIVFVPDTQLPAGRGISLFGRAYDHVGNSSSFNVRFRTALTSDSTLPLVVYTTPADGEGNVAVNVNVAVRLSKPISATSVSKVSLMQDGQTIDTQVSLEDANQVIRLRGAKLLSPNSVYIIDLNGATDLAGNPVPRILTGFVTGTDFDTKRPAVESFNPNYAANDIPINTTFSVRFDEPVTQSALTAPAISLINADTQSEIPATRSFSGKSDLVLLDPIDSLPPNTRFSLRVTDTIQDAAGNPARGDSTYFETGSEADSSAPLVRHFNLLGRTAVPVNAQLVVSFTEPMMPLSNSRAATALSKNGVPVAVTHELDSTGMRLTITPLNNLIRASNYQLQLGNYQDVAGNELAPFTGSFSTSNSLSEDRNGPAIISRIPNDNATEVATNSSIVITYHEDIDPTSVSSDTVSLRVSTSPYGNGEIATTQIVDGDTLTITPLDPLPGAVTVNVRINNVTDFVGNNSSYSSSWSFETANTVETTAPELLMSYPEDGATGVPRDTTLLLAFSENLNPSTLTNSNLTVFVDGKLQNARIQNMADAQSVLVESYSNSADSLVEVVIGTGVTDLSGNPFAGQTIAYRTTTTVTEARVVQQRPNSGSNKIPSTTSISLLFDTPIAAETLDGGLFITENGQVIDITNTLRADGQILEIVPTTPFQSNAIIEVFLTENVTARNGRAIRSYRGRFYTEDDGSNSLPQIVRDTTSAYDHSIPGGGPQNLALEFESNEPLNPTTIDNSTVTLTDSNSTPVARLVLLSSDGRVIRILPTGPLDADATYRVLMNGVEDSTGNPLTYSSRFVTGKQEDTQAPSALAFSPADTSIDVPLNASLQVRFSESVNPISVTNETLTLRDAQNNSIPTTFSFASNNATVTLQPLLGLEPESFYRISANAVTDRAGNAITPRETTFTTGSTIDLEAPTAIGQTPGSDSDTRNVPVNSPIVIHLDERLNPVALAETAIQLRDNALAAMVPGATELSADGMTISFVPDVALAVGRDYRYSFSFRDLANNVGYSSSTGFTTSFSGDTRAPTLLASTPQDGSSNVARNATLTATFDEAISPASVSGLQLNSNDGKTALKATLKNSGTTLLLTANRLLKANSAYSLNFNDLYDLAGNALPASTMTFYTGDFVDTTAPTLIARSLPNSNNSSEPTIPRNPRIRFVFSEALDPNSINSAHVQIRKDSTGVAVPGTITLANDGTSVIWTPDNLLPALTRFNSFLSNQITDLTGNPLSSYNYYRDFTTTDQVDETNPIIASVSLANGVVAPVNASLALRFNEAIDTSLLSQNTVNITGPDGVVAGTISVGSSTGIVTLLPNQPLQPSTTYTVSVSNITDQSGNVLAPFTSTFTTSDSAIPDTTRPTMIASSPASGATEVAATTSIVFFFSEAMDPTTIDSGSLSVSVTSSDGAKVAFDYVVNGAVINITPQAPLPGNASIRVSGSGFKDLAGNLTSNSVYSSFTTASATDNTSPVLLSVNPQSNGFDAGDFPDISLMYSEAMHPGTVNTTNIALFVNGQSASYSLRRSDDSRTIIVDNNHYPDNAVVELIVSDGLTDLSGNSAVPFSTSFNTGAARSDSEPRVIDQRPHASTNNVPADSVFALFLNQPLDANSVGNALRLSVNGVLVSGTVRSLANGYALEFKPDNALPADAVLQLHLTTEALGSNGQPVRSFTTTLRTGNTNATNLEITQDATLNVSRLPTNGNLNIEFNQPIDLSTLNATSVRLTQTSSDTGIPLSLELSENNTQLRINPISELTAESTYRLSIADVAAQNSDATLNYSRFFTTDTGPDNNAPTVVGVSLRDGLTAAPLNTKIRIAFSEAINALSADASAVALVDSNANAVPLSIQFDHRDMQLLVVPMTALEANSSYSLQVTGVEDLAGNIQDEYGSSFTTSEEIDVSNLEVIASYPHQNANNAPVNALVEFVFDDRVDPLSVNENTISVTNSNTFTRIPGTINLSNDGVSISFIPTEPYAPNSTFRASLDSNNLRNIAGLFGSYSSTLFFNTSATTDSTAPILISSNPMNTAESIPRNLRAVVLQFDETVRLPAASSVTLSSNTQSINGVFSGADSNRRLSFAPRQLLEANTRYTLTLIEPTDITGNIGSPISTSFTTSDDIDLSAPLLTGTTPVNRSTAVSRDTTLALNFSEPLSGAALLLNRITLRDRQTYDLIEISQTLSPDGTSITLTPSAPLAANSQYEVRMSSASITDIAGNAYRGTTFPLSFTTGH